MSDEPDIYPDTIPAGHQWAAFLVWDCERIDPVLYATGETFNAVDAIAWDAIADNGQHLGFTCCRITPDGAPLDPVAFAQDCDLAFGPMTGEGR